VPWQHRRLNHRRARRRGGCRVRAALARRLPYCLAIALLSTALPYTLEMIALTKLPARTLASDASSRVRALAGWTMLQERLAAGQWAAIILIISPRSGTTWTATAQRQLAVPMPE